MEQIPLTAVEQMEQEAAWPSQVETSAAQADQDHTENQADSARSDHPVASVPTIIAIDGPAGAGKSTIGRLLAEQLSYLFFDTGAMYRAITWAALQKGVPLDDADALSELAATLPMNIRYPTEDEKIDGRAYTVEVEDRDVTSEIRKSEIEKNVSLVSAYGGVREALVRQQRKVAESVGAVDGTTGLVMAGRDIGTVVLYDADLKIYLDASSEERARRRHAELETRGAALSFEQTLADVERRDDLDSHRAISPLRMADDAVQVVTDGLGIEETLGRVTAIVYSLAQ